MSFIARAIVVAQDGHDRLQEIGYEFVSSLLDESSFGRQVVSCATQSLVVTFVYAEALLGCSTEVDGVVVEHVVGELDHGLGALLVPQCLFK